MTSHRSILALVLSFAIALPVLADDALPPGVCPGDDAEGVSEALDRADAVGDAAANLDVAACYRMLDQAFPEAVALQRALAAGLSDSDALLVEARLDQIGRPLPIPPPTPAPEAPEASPAAGVETPGAEPVWPWTLAGVAAAAIAAATVTGFLALDQDASGEDPTTLGITAGSCAALGIAAGIAAVILWPDDEVVPTSGPGDVGLGIRVRF